MCLGEFSRSSIRLLGYNDVLKLSSQSNNVEGGTGEAYIDEDFTQTQHEKYAEENHIRRSVSEQVPKSPQRSVLMKRGSSRQLSESFHSTSTSMITPISEEKATHVSFTDVMVREYDVTVGDNPSCSFGPPISLGWSFKSESCVSLEEYESKHEQHRRTSKELIIDSACRNGILTEQAGISQKEIEHAMKIVEKVRQDRAMTEIFLPLARVEEVSQSFKRKVKRIRNVRKMAHILVT
eukprot:272667_1